MQPFQVEWDAARLRRVHDQVGRYRFPPTPRDPGWRYGCDPAFLRELCTYWADGFDADAAAARLNRFPQVVHRVEGIDLHAVHVVGEVGGRRPLLLTHGWPGSTYEFWEVAEPLAFPSRFGGDPADAFDLIIPSLPGYGFSGKPAAPLSMRTTARLFDRLMTEGFGYRRYLAQGGDLGSGVAAWLALEHAASIRAIHLNYLLVQPSGPPTTAEEIAWQAAKQETDRQLGAYSHLHNTRPQSLAYAMEDNPVAQLAWIVERFHDWSDQRARPFDAIFSRDQLLTDVMIYVMNDAFTTATWFYAAAAAEQAREVPAGRRIEVPTAFTCYNDPRTPNPPRSWVERGYALDRWVEQPRGGHFAALEAPDLFVADLRDWGRSVAEG